MSHSNDNLSIVKVDNKKLLRAYIDFPHDLYAEDDNYVPEIYMSMKDLFNPKKNPFFENAEIQSYLAFRDKKIVGRITAIMNNNYNLHHKSNVGFFGFYDVIDEYQVSKLLLDTAMEWCKGKKVDAVLGPTNFSTNDTAGVLIDGFDEPPKVMMTYNKPYYQTHLERYGCVKEMDLFAYILYTNKASEKSIRLAQALEERLSRQGITFRNLRKKNFTAEVDKLLDTYNSAWKDNWGFVPMSDAEMRNMGEHLKMIANPDWLFIAEDKGQVIGFGLTVNNINEITKDFKKGRLFPFNILKLLRRRFKTRYVRILALGVKEGYRRKGIEAIFFAKNILQAKKDNIIAGEVSWVLENNPEMNASARKLNSELYKKYRIYRYNLA